jgi:hypothetical protein
LKKNVNFFNGGVFFLLTSPLMGDPIPFTGMTEKGRFAKVSEGKRNA